MNLTATQEDVKSLVDALNFAEKVERPLYRTAVAPE